MSALAGWRSEVAGLRRLEGLGAAGNGSPCIVQVVRIAHKCCLFTRGPPMGDMRLLRFQLWCLSFIG
jgi:hypothetical protein